MFADEHLGFVEIFYNHDVGEDCLSSGDIVGSENKFFDGITIEVEQLPRGKFERIKIAFQNSAEMCWAPFYRTAADGPQAGDGGPEGSMYSSMAD